MKHWRHHPDDEALNEITFEVFQTLTQSLVEHFKELLMAAVDDVLTAAAATDQAAVAFIQNLQAELAAAQAPDPNVQALADALDTANQALSAIVSPPAPAPAPVLDPADSLPLYAPVAGTVVDTSVWTAVADVSNTDGTTLYTFTHDTAGSAPTGVSAGWTLFQGTPTQGAPTA